MHQATHGGNIANVVNPQKGDFNPPATPTRSLISTTTVNMETSPRAHTYYMDIYITLSLGSIFDKFTSLIIIIHIYAMLSFTEITVRYCILLLQYVTLPF